MGPSCPECGKSSFTYRSLLAVHPYRGEFNPARIICPSCGTELRVTTASRLLSAAIFLASVFGVAALLVLTALDIPRWLTFVIIIGTMCTYFFAIWPLTVRFKPWTPFRYWLPKSRLVGYTVYLLLPVALMVLVLILLAKFKVGM